MLMKPKPAAHHQKWTPEAEAELRQRCEDGEFLPAIARAMGRTQASCASRAAILGISCKSR